MAAAYLCELHIAATWSMRSEEELTELLSQIRNTFCTIKSNKEQRAACTIQKAFREYNARTREQKRQWMIEIGKWHDDLVEKVTINQNGQRKANPKKLIPLLRALHTQDWDEWNKGSRTKITGTQHINLFLTKLRNRTDTGKSELLADELATCFDLTKEQAQQILVQAAIKYTQETPPQLVPVGTLTGCDAILPTAIEIILDSQIILPNDSAQNLLLG